MVVELNCCLVELFSVSERSSASLEFLAKFLVCLERKSRPRQVIRKDGLPTDGDKEVLTESMGEIWEDMLPCNGGEGG